PYERPPLSKDVLAGKLPEEKLYLRSAEYYDEQRIELLLGARAIRLDPGSRVVEIDDGSRVAYDQLLIATGATPRRLEVPGAALDNIFYLRTLQEARSIAAAMRTARLVVVVGAGFIGAEVAASCRLAGLEVVLLEVLPVPLERALGPTIGHVYAEVHRSRGVELRTSEGVVGFEGNGHVERVVGSSGTVYECDFAVVGVGVVPECGWLIGSGVELGNGVVVDELCRTSVPGVFAAGDVANWWHPTLGERLRLEHYDNAQFQGVAAAKSMLGKGEPYAPVPFFWSDQYDLTLQYVGHGRGDDDVILRGSPDSTSWSAFFLRNGTLRAALGVNRYKDISASRQLLAKQVPVTPEQLADESCDLRALARGRG
ncbi:MAG: FAD-dependent oxidoreductase, partial [Chloroflexi bacterium]|nr:FAD-dependent oxidoreductase [Chloroflexota bacterium]